MIDFATQVLLVILGFVLVFSPEILVDNIHWGVAPTWANLAIAVPVAMLAYTGVETVSNLAEEAREPERSVPNAYKLVAAVTFTIYLTLPLIALSALPVKEIDGELTTLLALPPEEGGYANDPILGVVENLGVEGRLLDLLQVYVGVLAATILIIATNAGIIGASRITYSMATYRQIPEVFRRLHPRFKTPYLALVIFAGIAPILILLPGDVNFVGTLYSLGATLSFTIAHASLVRLRTKDDGSGAAFRARPNLRLGNVDWPVFAVLGGIATGVSFLVILVQNPLTRWVGLGWMVLGLIAYAVYRRRFVEASVTSTVKAPPAFGAGARARVPSDRRPHRARPPVGRRARRRLPARGRARRTRRRAHGARGAARPAARHRRSRRTSASRTPSSTRRSRSATRTASASSGDSSAGAARRSRSCARPSGARPRSSSSARRARTSSAGGAASSARRSTA